jgi:hypothetical protein
MPNFPAIDPQGHNPHYPQIAQTDHFALEFLFFVAFFFFFAEAQPVTGVAEFRGSVRTPYN